MALKIAGLIILSIYISSCVVIYIFNSCFIIDKQQIAKYPSFLDLLLTIFMQACIEYYRY